MFATKRTGRFFTTANPEGFPAIATVGPDGKVSVEADTNEGRQTFADVTSINHNDARVDGSFFQADKPADPPAKPVETMKKVEPAPTKVTELHKSPAPPPLTRTAGSPKTKGH